MRSLISQRLNIMPGQWYDRYVWAAGLSSAVQNAYKQNTSWETKIWKRHLHNCIKQFNHCGSSVCQAEKEFYINWSKAKLSSFTFSCSITECVLRVPVPSKWDRSLITWDFIVEQFYGGNHIFWINFVLFRL